MHAGSLTLYIRGYEWAELITVQTCGRYASLCAGFVGNRAVASPAVMALVEDDNACQVSSCKGMLTLHPHRGSGGSAQGLERPCQNGGCSAQTLSCFFYECQVRKLPQKSSCQLDTLIAIND